MHTLCPPSEYQNLFDKATLDELSRHHAPDMQYDVNVSLERPVAARWFFRGMGILS
jgi:hypothetical protein